MHRSQFSLPGRWRDLAVAAAARLRGWSIRGRLALIVVALAVPLNLLIFFVVSRLADAGLSAARTSLLYTARSVEAGLDAQLGKYIALAKVLAASPALLEDNFELFAAEARRAFPDGEAWVLVADPEGRQLLNTSAPAGAPLPARDPVGVAAQKRAFASRSPVVSDVLRNPLSDDWVATVEMPVYRRGRPFRALAVVISASAFLQLLSVHEMPSKWLAGIIDREGRFIARVPDNAGNVGGLASQGWRAVKNQEGLFEFPSLEGDALIQGNVPSALSGWTVGIAVKKSELSSARTVRWAMLGAAVLPLTSLLLAFAIARRIVHSMQNLQVNTAALLAGRATAFEPGIPEVGDLWTALRKTIADRDRSQTDLAGLRDWLAAIVTSSTDAILSKDLDGIVTSWNRSAEQMFGYTAKEMIGQSIRLLVPPDRQSEEDMILARIRGGERIEQFETVRRHKSGRPIDVSVTISPIRDASGRQVGASTIARDITEHKKQVKALRESEQRLSQILNNVNAYIGLLDAKGIVTEINSPALEAAGATREAVVGKPFADAPWWTLSPEAQQQIRTFVARSLSGEAIRADLKYATAAGQPGWMDFQAAPIVDDDGVVVGVVPSGVDITARKDAEQRVQLLMREVNHRAKNLLGVVLAVANHTTAPSVKAYVDRFSQRIRALSFNQDLLVKNDWRGIDMKELVHAQLAHFSDLIGRRITLEGPPLRLTSGAAQAIGMALHELATNAGKYGALSNGKGRIAIAWQVADGELQLDWSERNGPPVEEPATLGFGSVVMVDLVKAGVDGEVDLAYAPAGLKWHLKCPASNALEHDFG